MASPVAVARDSSYHSWLRPWDPEQCFRKSLMGTKTVEPTGRKQPRDTAGENQQVTETEASALG